MRIPFTALTRGGPPLAAAVFGLLFRLTGRRAGRGPGGGHAFRCSITAPATARWRWGVRSAARSPTMPARAALESRRARTGSREAGTRPARPATSRARHPRDLADGRAAELSLGRVRRRLPRYLRVSGIEMRDDRDFVVGDPTSDSQSELTLGYGHHRVGESFAVGGTPPKARHQSLAGFSASGAGIDAGATGYPAAVLGLSTTGVGAQHWRGALDLEPGCAWSQTAARRRERRRPDDSPRRLRLARPGARGPLWTIVVQPRHRKPERSSRRRRPPGFEFQPVPRPAPRGGMSGGTLTAGDRGPLSRRRVLDAMHLREPRLRRPPCFGVVVRVRPDRGRAARPRASQEEERLQARLEVRVPPASNRSGRRAGRARAVAPAPAASTRPRSSCSAPRRRSDTVRTDVAPLVAACEIGQALQLETAGNY